ncbi:MAG: DUF6498-containing protein [Minisyncoccota bacterium]
MDAQEHISKHAPSPREVGMYFLHDPTSFSLVVSNLIVIAMAVAQQWNLVTVLWVYWVQSVIIGVITVGKVLLLKDFSTEGFMMGGKKVDPTPATKRQAALLFLIFYGFFHALYAVFISKFSGDILMIKANWSEVGMSALYFLTHHAFSFFYHSRERESTPNIGRVITFPFLRILPMHITIVVGGGILIATHASLAVLVLFLLIKTGADLVMHTLEHVQVGDSVAIS